MLMNDSLLAVIIEVKGKHGKQMYKFDEDTLHQQMLNYGFDTFSYFPFERHLLPARGKKVASSKGNALYIRGNNLEEVIKRISSTQRFNVQDQLV